MGHGDSYYPSISGQGMKNSVFALIDCNNFFASCERIFRPDLEGKPVVVLSSNDGCVVARSNETKALGIPMAAPAFKYRDIFRRYKVVQFSANFDLYGDISRRITEVLSTITPRIEIYSVDESFLDLSELQIPDYTIWGRMVRDLVLRWIGVPVSIGIAPTKTLAKLASDRAKKSSDLNGVLDLTVQGSTLYSNLMLVEVKDVWGIGRRLAPKIRAEGIMNALELSTLRPQLAQQLMGIHGRQLVAELNGISCYPLESMGKPRRSIARTRTFGHDTNDFSALEAAIASFASQAAFRLRTSRQLTRRAAVFLTTNKHKPGYTRFSREVIYPMPTADTGWLISSLVTELKNLYSPNYTYHRGGVMLYDFVPIHALQTDLLGSIRVKKHDRATNRLTAIDSLNEKFGKRTVHYAAEDLGFAWKPIYNLRSPRYTTHLDELPTLTPI
jgi:DNA polymerase V